MNERTGKILHISKVLEMYYPQFKQKGGKNKNLGGLGGKTNSQVTPKTFSQN